MKLDKKGRLQVFDKNWNLLKEIDFNEKIPILSRGKNKIIFDALFSGEGSSKIKLEIKTIGSGESVKAAAGS